ncbi:MAG: hypothetical protein GTN49_05760 [candidate division Zixibacteria bacterium]|nr:hypothetical protein [candidate division Zixibacteria bacterium]
MRRIAFVTVVILLKASAFPAETEYEYPAGYADFFNAFRAVTPEEAQVAISLKGAVPGYDCAGSAILEPIKLNTMGGLPGVYFVVCYKGTDDKIRDVAEDVIIMLNDANGFDPYILKGKLEQLMPFSRDFCSYDVRAWTWDEGITVKMPDSIHYLLQEYPDYLNAVETEYGLSGIENAKIFASSATCLYIVHAFENDKGTKRYFYGPPHKFVETDEAELSRFSTEELEGWYGLFKNHSPLLDKYRAWWVEVLEQSDRAEKKDGYLRIIYNDNGYDATEHEIEGVPDFNQHHHEGNIGDCWAWATVAVFTYWSRNECIYVTKRSWG